MIDDSNLSGPINAVSPHPVTNRELSATVAKVLGRPNWLPAPAYAIRLALGEVAEVVTAGQRVIPSKLRTIGFPFRFPTVQEALADLLLPSKA
jgi:NAD dependent epimerase/dehydratase family enzyme